MNLIAIGNKARQGKDTLAEMLMRLLPGSSVITHFADPLKEELQNLNNPLPLVFRKKCNGTLYYFLYNGEKYDAINAKLVPKLHKIFTDRKIKEYQGMTEKDSEMLQFWGTDYRRVFYSEDFWVRKMNSKLLQLAQTYKTVIIADCRNLNEFESVKSQHGVYVSIKRILLNDTQFIDPNRDPNHISEIALDNITADYSLVVKDNDMIEFEEKATQLAKTLKERFKLK